MQWQIAEAIKAAPKLTDLELGGNNLGADGASAIAAAIKGHKELKTLDLSSNAIGVGGARALADALKFDLAVSVRLGIAGWWAWQRADGLWISDGGLCG